MSEPVVTSTSSNHSVPLSKPHTNQGQGPISQGAPDTNQGATPNTSQVGSTPNTNQTSTPNQGATPHQDPHSVANESVPPESRPVGDPEHGTTGPDDKPPGAPEGEDYPPQLHAGKVGLGPHYAEVHGNESGLGSKITGIKEQLKGKVTRNPDLVQKGHDRQTGELKAKEQAEDDSKSPFSNAGEDKSEKKEGGAEAKEGAGAEPKEGAGVENKDGGAPPPPNAPNAVSAEKTAPQ